MFFDREENLQASSEWYQYVDQPKQDPGFFEGMGEAASMIPANVILHTTAFLMDTFTGIYKGLPTVFGDEKEVNARILENEAFIARLRKNARELNTPDPNRVGLAGQVLFGVGTSLGKVGAGTLLAAGNPYGGAALFGISEGMSVEAELKEKGVDPDTARNTALVAAGGSSLGVVIPAGFGLRRIPNALLGATLNVSTGAAQSLGMQYVLENNNYNELANQWGYSWTEGSTDAVLGAALGAILGKGGSAPRKQWINPPTQPAPIPAPQTPPAPQRTQQAPQQQGTLDFQQPTPQRTQQAPIQPEPTTQTQPIQPTQVGDTVDGQVLQNRDRGTADSVVQMQQIAAHPDYDRLKGGDSLGEGAPIVDGVGPHVALGDRITTTAVDGSKYEVQYAVVEADEVVTSHLADGTVVAEFNDASYSGPRAIAGNGRIAGIKEAYHKGSASEYRQKLEADAKNKGIDPEEVRKMKSPVLVRVIDKKQATTKLVDLSNQSGVRALNSVEQAMTDANRIDLDAIEFDAQGRVTAGAVRSFVLQMPEQERGSLLLGDLSTPSDMGRRRYEGALIAKAYGDRGLVNWYLNSNADARLKSLILKLAPHVYKLDGLGALDFRSDLLEALRIVGGRDATNTMRSASDQGQLFSSPESQLLARAFAYLKNKDSEGLFVQLIKDAVKQAESLKQESQGATMFDSMDSLSEADGKRIIFENFEKRLEGFGLRKPTLEEIDSAQDFHINQTARDSAPTADSASEVRALDAEQSVIHQINTKEMPQVDETIVDDGKLGEFVGEGSRKFKDSEGVIDETQGAKDKEIPYTPEPAKTDTITEARNVVNNAPVPDALKQKANEIITQVTGKEPPLSAEQKAQALTQETVSYRRVQEDLEKHSSRSMDLEDNSSRTHLEHKVEEEAKAQEVEKDMNAIAEGTICMLRNGGLD